MYNHKKNIFIHVGMPKTGTSYLQRYIFPQIKGVAYLDRSNQFYNQLFRNIIIENEYFTLREKTKNEFLEFINHIKEDTILISDEAWFGGVTGALFLNYSNHKQLLNLLKEIFPDAKIILTVRRQAEYILSLYKHSIRDGYHMGISQFINYSKKEFGRYEPFDINGVNIDVRSLNYFAYYKEYTKMFGEENVLLMPQEALIKEFSMFQESLLIFMKKIQTLSFIRKNVNQGLNYYGLKVAKLINPLFLFPNRPGGLLPNGRFIRLNNDNSFSQSSFYKRIIHLLTKFDPFKLGKAADILLKSKKKLVSDDMKEEIMEIHKETNKELGKHCQFNLQKYNYY